MSGPNHIAGGIVFTGIYLSMWDKNIFAHPSFLFFTAFFSVLPDIDHTKSLVGKAFYPIAVYLDRKFGHRTITHSLLCYVILIIVIRALERIFLTTNDISQIFIWAYGSHLILDMLTIQGIPLFYPFKKNPCVIPGNPKFRFRGSDFRTESMMFFVFILLAFSFKDLYANGFWNTYNRTWNSLKALSNERRIAENLLEVDYEVSINNKIVQGSGIVIEANLTHAIIFDKGFLRIENNDRIIELKPIRTSKNLLIQELTFTDVSFDSLQNLIRNKPLISLKLQSVLPIQYSKNNKPQSSHSVELDHCYNPVLLSEDLDSMDLTTAKEIELAKQELSNHEQQLKIYKSQQAQYEFQKKEASIRYMDILDNISSLDLATREKAIKELNAAKIKYESFNQIRLEPINQLNAINIKLEFLKSKLYTKKQQKINGYISYFIIN